METEPPDSPTVLVADDDPHVLAYVLDVLRQDGHAVVGAPDGRSAQGLFEAHSGSIRLLVTDLIMPGMSGRELGKQLMALRGDLRVLYISGLGPAEAAEHGIGEEEFLKKPFLPSVLIRKVREALGA